MQTRQDSSFWDQYHEDYKGKSSLATDSQERISGIYVKKTLSVILRHINFDQLKNSVLLDYGCGTGRLSKLLAPYCKKIICVDVSNKFLESTKKNLKMFDNIEYELALPGKPLSFSANSIDLSYSYAAINWTTEDNFWYSINDMDRVSKAFCVQISEPNENVNIAETDANKELPFVKVKGYRPKLTTLKARYSENNYLFEYLQPDTRGLELFFYKIAFNDLDSYLDFGVHIYDTKPLNPEPVSFRQALQLSIKLFRLAVKRRLPLTNRQNKI